MNELNAHKNFIYQRMSKVSLNKAIRIFYENFDIMNGVKILFTDTDKGSNPLKPFLKDYDIQKGVLSTPFRYDSFYLMSQKIGFNAVFSQNTRVGCFYDISLDTNMVSYIDKYYRDKKQSPELNELSRVFTSKRKYSSAISVDPYIYENSLFKDEIPSHVKSTLINFFDSVYNSHMKLRFLSRFKAKSHVKRILTHSKRDKYRIPKVYLEYRYKMIYLMMLKTYEIGIKNISYTSKIKEILNFANDKIKKLMLAELILAFEFFQKGTKIRFFSKLQKNNKNIIKDIKNLSWDLFHLRSLEMNMMYVKHKKADITIPLFYSMDEKFNEIRSIVKLKMIVLDYSQNNYIPFYENNVVQKK